MREQNDAVRNILNGGAACMGEFELFVSNDGQISDLLILVMLFILRWCTCKCTLHAMITSPNCSNSAHASKQSDLSSKIKIVMFHFVVFKI